MVFADREARYIGARSREWIHDIALAKDVAKVEDVAGSEVVVEPDAKLVVVGGFVECGDESVAAQIGKRVVREKILGNWVDERNLVVGKRLWRGRENIEDLAVGTGTAGVHAVAVAIRSEERRVGKECRSR